ncbi:hypothetical protein HRbin28_01313 [bacterium HR28]|nr:hypothetical protein HRbin28_01313 [bacterium HR28]
MLPRFIEDEGDALTIGARCRVGGALRAASRILRGESGVRLTRGPVERARRGAARLRRRS